MRVSSRAEQSTGIETALPAIPDTTDWSPEMKALLEEALPIYEELYINKLKADE